MLRTNLTPVCLFKASHVSFNATCLLRIRSLTHHSLTTEEVRDQCISSLPSNLESSCFWSNLSVVDVTLPNWAAKRREGGGGGTFEAILTNESTREIVSMILRPGSNRTHQNIHAKIDNARYMHISVISCRNGVRFLSGDFCTQVDPISSVEIMVLPTTGPTSYRC